MAEPAVLASDELAVEQVGVELGPWPGAVGRVVDVGAELAPERTRLIDRLVALPSLRCCGACLPCRRGHPAMCARRSGPPPRGQIDRVAARVAVVFDDALAAPAPAPLAAALAGTGLHAYGAVVRAGVEPNRAGLVLGRGPLAAFVAALVEHRGAVPIRCDGIADAARIAATLAERGVEPFAVPVIAAVDDAEAACALASPGATVVLAVPASAPGRAAALVTERGLTLIGHTGTHPDLLLELCAFAASGRLSLAPLCQLVEDPPRGPSHASDERATVWTG
jgi:threonine dehydrogenase-like Zn-dependent dehydrogenase